MYWNDKKVIVTGGNGFLGKAVVRKLKEKQCKEIIIPRRKQYNLTIESDVDKLFRDNNDVDIVIHLAADVGGIEYNRKNPGSVYYNNLMINTLMMEYSRRNNINKFVGIGSVCSYPKFSEVPFKEDQLWDGYPEETNAPYGLSKKMMLEQGIAYRKQYDFNAIHLLMINLYGPEDNFDLNNSHVIPGLIRKFVEAKFKNEKSVTVWGDGSASREFLYVDDAAEAIVLASEKYNESLPINIGNGQEIEIYDLVYIISELVEYKGEIKWDKEKPNGQPRRCLDTSVLEKKIGFKASKTLNDGLRQTIDFYTKRYLVNCT